MVGQTAKERLVGSWTLVSLTAGEGADQSLPYGPNPKGSMMVDANGRFMITVVRSDLPNFASNNRMRGTPDENNSVVQGSIAYYGTYTIDEATRVITVNVEGSTFPNFIGGTQTRILSFDGDEVTYLNPTPSHGGAPAKVTYRRAKSRPCCRAAYRSERPIRADSELPTNMREQPMRRMKRSQRACAIGIALAAILGSIGSAPAEVYPSRPITMVVPYPAGGLFDALARILAEPMRAALAQTVVIENVGGAGGSIAVGRVARAAPDGYTVAIGSADQFVVNAAIYSLPYDVVNDFEPVALVMSGPLLIVSKTAVPAANLKELMAWLKANHAQVTQGHNGSGGAQHLCGVELQRIVGASWQFVPYRGAAPALQDVVGGRVDVMCPSPASSLAMVQSGLLRAYAVTDATRLTSAPDIPTVDEAGFPQLHISVWGGLFVPKGTPKSVIAKLNSATTIALADPVVRRQLANIGQEVVPRGQQTPEALAAVQRADIEKWWPIIKAANIKAE